MNAADKLAINTVLAGKGHGKLYDHRTDSEPSLVGVYEDYLGSITQEVDKFRASLTGVRRFPRLVAAIGSDATVNARVFGTENSDGSINTYYVVVYRGAVVQTINVLHQLAQRLDVFPWLDEIADGEIKMRYSPVLPHTLSGTEDEPSSALLPVRYLATSWMNSIALEFLAFHELCHVFGGHLEIALSAFNLDMLAEATSTANASTNAMSVQALEWEADTYASRLLVRKYFICENGHFSRLPFLAHCDDKPLKLFVLVLAAISTVLKLLERELPTYDTWETLTHPPALVRRYAILRSLEVDLKSFGLGDPAHQEAIREALEVVDGAIHEICASPPLPDAWRDRSYLAKCCELHLQKLWDHHKALAGQLAKASHTPRSSS
jgi:hypothetical protein